MSTRNHQDSLSIYILERKQKCIINMLRITYQPHIIIIIIEFNGIVNGNIGAL